MQHDEMNRGTDINCDTANKYVLVWLHRGNDAREQDSHITCA